MGNSEEAAYVQPLLKAFGATNQATLFEGKKVVLFFAAEWHAWGRKTLLPKLTKIYADMKAEGKQVEFLFVSCDKTTEEFERFSKTMPWPKVPYDDETREQLISLFVPKNKVGQPFIVVLDDEETRKVLSAPDAVQRIISDGTFPWQLTGGDVACMACTTAFFCTVL